MQPSDSDRLQAIFRAVFGYPDTRDVTSLRQISEKKWDSLGHTTLVAAIESEFDVAIDGAEALQMTSFEATRLLLEEKIS